MPEPSSVPALLAEAPRATVPRSAKSPGGLVRSWPGPLHDGLGAAPARRSGPGLRLSAHLSRLDSLGLTIAWLPARERHQDLVVRVSAWDWVEGRWPGVGEREERIGKWRQQATSSVSVSVRSHPDSASAASRIWGGSSALCCLNHFICKVGP